MGAPAAPPMQPFVNPQAYVDPTVPQQQPQYGGQPQQQFDTTFNTSAPTVAAGQYPYDPSQTFNVGYNPSPSPQPQHVQQQMPIGVGLQQAQQQMPMPMQPGSVPQHQFAMFQQPIVQDMAMQYGQKLADQGKQLMESQFEKYIPVTRLKYYFAVDNKYVINKLRLLLFPFTHSVNVLLAYTYTHTGNYSPYLIVCIIITGLVFEI